MSEPKETMEPQVMDVNPEETVVKKTPRVEIPKPSPVEQVKIVAHCVPFVWLYTLVVALIMFAITRDFMLWPFNFILGSATSLFNFTILVNFVNSRRPEALKKGMFLNYLIRYAMYAIVLGAIFYKDGLDGVWPTVIGFLSLKIVLVVYTLIKRGEKI